MHFTQKQNATEQYTEFGSVRHRWFRSTEIASRLPASVEYLYRGEIRCFA